MTDDWDRRVLLTYIGDVFKDEAIDIPYYKYVGHRYPLLQVRRPLDIIPYYKLCMYTVPVPSNSSQELKLVLLE